MNINDLLKAYGVNFTLEFNGEDNEVNPDILSDATIVTSTNDEFKLHSSDDDGALFELIVKPPNTVIYNFYAPDGELYMSHSYSDEGIVIGN